MSLAVGAVSSSKSMALDEGKEASAVAENENAGSVAADGAHKRHMSEASCYYESEEDEDEEGKGNRTFELGPQFTIKEQFEKDKDDESLRRWKEQPLGSVDLNSVGENLDPDVKIVSISILSPGRPELALPLPVSNPKGLWFTLKEGSCYSLKFSFLVSNNIVSGFTYTNTVWKTGVKVDSTKQMIGTFSPQPEPYILEIAEETTPSGMFARGSYSAKTKTADLMMDLILNDPFKKKLLVPDRFALVFFQTPLAILAMNAEDLLDDPNYSSHLPSNSNTKESPSL